MIPAARFIEAARERGFGLYSGVPCSYLKPFINYTIGAEGITYVGAANEGDAVAIAAGAQIGGLGSVAMFQNSGLGNAVSPLTSLNHTFRIPVLLIPTLRGDPDGSGDEPQHELMGAITTQLLELMQIPWAWFPDDEADVDSALDRAVGHMAARSTPYALVMRKGSVAPADLSSTAQGSPAEPGLLPPLEPIATRRDALRAIQAGIGDDDLVIASTGFAGRELYALDDRANQLYMVGSMGCASSLGLGLAMARPDRRVVVIDGDGAALMRLGALTTVGHERPDNLLHIVLDNAVHESTGGQATVSGTVDFCALAGASGYPCVRRVAEPGELESLVADRRALAQFVHVPIHAGTPDDLPRPTIGPPEVAARFRSFIAATD